MSPSRTIVPRSVSQKGFYWSLCLLVISFPFSIAVNSIVTGLLLLFFLLDVSSLKSNLRQYRSNPGNLLLLGLFATLAVSLAYSSNKEAGVSRLIAFLPLVSIPLALTRVEAMPERQKKSLEHLHILVSLLASIVCLAKAAISSGLLDASYRNLVAPELYPAWFVHRFTYHQLSEHVGLHAIYFSFFLSLAFFLLVQQMERATRWRRWIGAMLLLFFSVMLLLLNSVMINAALYGFLLLYAYLRLSFKKGAHHFLFYGLALFAGGITYYLFILKYVGGFPQNAYFFDRPELNKNFGLLAALMGTAAVAAVAVKLLFPKRHLVILGITAALAIAAGGFTLYQKKEPQRAGNDTGTNNVNARFGNWTGALMVIGEHPVTGVGLGDEMPALTEKYREIGFESGVREQFNAHNQYLEFWVGSGLLAVVFFAGLLVRETYKAIRQRNAALLCLLFVFAVFCISESVLLRQPGRIFFLFFLCVLGAGCRKDRARTAAKQVESSCELP